MTTGWPSAARIPSAIIRPVVSVGPPAGYGTTIVTTRKILETKPDVLRRFVKASMEGWRDYIKNPGPGNALIKVDNAKMSDDQIAFGIQKMKELKVLDAGGVSGREKLAIAPG